MSLFTLIAIGRVMWSERLCIKEKKETLLVYGVDGWVENKKGVTTHVVLFFRPPQRQRSRGA